VSTGDQSLGLAGQLDLLEAEAKRRDWKAEVITDEISGTVPVEERPALGPALASLEAGDVLVVAKLDRLSRSVGDFAQLVDRSLGEGWRIVVLDLGIDMTKPNGRLIAGIIVQVAQWEREMISTRTKQGLAKSKKRLGRRPGLPPVGGGKAAPVSEKVLAVVADAREERLTPQRMADRLNAYGLPSVRGKRWHATSVSRLLTRLDATG
jgi:DNA invertase Pin-like site-specific DNA recombinase